MSFEAAERAFAAGDARRGRDLLRSLFASARVRTLLFAFQRTLETDMRGPDAELTTELFEQLELGALPRLDRVIRDYRIADASGSEGGIGVLALLSMSRSGYLREAATAAVARSKSPISGAVLALRLNDYVAAVRDRAASGLSSRTRSLEALAMCVRLEGSVRAGGNEVRESLIRGFPNEALRSGRDHPDLDVRRACYQLLLERGDREVLGWMLEEREAQIRRIAARYILTNDLDIYQPRLEVDRASDIRALVIRHYAKNAEADDRSALLRACFDPDSTVRHLARRGLAKLGGATDLRARALRILNGEATERERVGALSVLADLGRREDEAVVRRFSARRGRVGREADRTLMILSGL
jgi:hypothetical protein